MSSPVNDEHHDKRYMYAPPWARETANESPEAIVEAIEQLRLERQRGTAAPSEAAKKPCESGESASGAPPAASDVADLEAAMADVIRASKWTPHSLDPVAMPEPPKPRLDGPTWGMVARLGGAVTAAAIVALFVGGVVRLPAIDVSLGARESAGPAMAQTTAAVDARPQHQPIVVADASPSLPPPADTAAAAPMSPTPVPPVIIPQAGAAPSSALPSDVLTAYASLDTPRATLLKSKGEGAQGPAATPPKLGELRALDRDELAGLVRRGQALLNEGDIASARLLLRRAAEAGDANAALLLAASYDRAELAKLKVIGVAADHAQAKLWYTKAVEHGSAEAVRRLQQLAQRPE